MHIVTHELPHKNALDTLRRVFDNFDEEIVGRRVLDFGCGNGFQACAMAKLGARQVIGLDTNPKSIAHARALALEMGLCGKVEFGDTPKQFGAMQFDVVISQNSMEHFADPANVIEQMKHALAPGGKLFITFGPPWFAPYGSHMRFITPLPWVNILLPERTVMKIRARYIHDGAMRYEDVEGGLNKMTLRKFEKLMRESGMTITHCRYDCVKGLNFLGRLPIMRELFINHISCIGYLKASPSCSHKQISSRKPAIQQTGLGKIVQLHCRSH